MAPSKIKKTVNVAVSLLAGIPSVVYGLVGMLILVPSIRKIFDIPDGASLLAAILIILTLFINILADGVGAYFRRRKNK